LSVPIGKDRLCFNMHRVYGEQRLPYLLNGWKQCDVFGWEEWRIREDRTSGGYQPVFVLEKHEHDNARRI